MRRSLISFLCALLVVPVLGMGASAKTHSGGEVIRIASAHWWRQTDANHGTYYIFEVYESTSSDVDSPHAARAYLWRVPCGVKRHRPYRCNFRIRNMQRPKVDSVEIDPLFGSAHATVHLGKLRGEIDWTGHGDYWQPMAFEGVSHWGFLPEFYSASASAMVFAGRDARARGDLFGLDLKRDEFRGGAIFDIVWASAGACVGAPWC